MWLKLLVSFCLLINGVSTFYLPGVAPKNFCTKESASESCPSQINILVNRLESSDSALSFGYHNFDFCPADKNVDLPAENLGQILFGERIEPSGYNVSFFILKKKKALHCCILV